jgi:hypothetical protein
VKRTVKRIVKRTVKRSVKNTVKGPLGPATPQHPDDRYGTGTPHDGLRVSDAPMPCFPKALTLLS